MRWLAGDDASPNLAPRTYNLPEIVLTSAQMRDSFIALRYCFRSAPLFLASQFGGDVDYRRRTTRPGHRWKTPLAITVLLVISTCTGFFGAMAGLRNKLLTFAQRPPRRCAERD